MKKAIAFWIIAVSTLGVITFEVFSVYSKEYLAIQNDSVYLGMSEKAIEKIKGSPIEVKKNIGDTPFDDYVFNEQLFGQQAKSSYSFYKSFFGLKLQSAYFVIDNLDYNEAKKLLNKVEDSLKKNNSNNKNYYNNGLEDDDGKSTFKLSLGTDNGIGGISCEICYSDKSFVISIAKQD